MRCPFCSKNNTKVIETREKGEEVARRRRECVHCKKRFTTYERVEMSPLIVIKKEGVRESFNREKVLKGLLRACEKRPVSIDRINKIIDEIETNLRNRSSSEIKSHLIGELIMTKLKKLPIWHE